MKPLSLCVLFLALAALPCCSSDSSRGYSKTAYKQGIADAKAEVAKDNLVLETFGLQVGGGSVYQQHLKDEYGIESRVVAGCVIDYEILGHARGFNEVMTAEIEKKWPQDVFKEAEETARQERSRGNGPSGKKPRKRHVRSRNGNAEANPWKRCAHILLIDKPRIST